MTNPNTLERLPDSGLDRWAAEQLCDVVRILLKCDAVGKEGPRLNGGAAEFTLWPTDDPSGTRKRFVSLTIHGDVGELVLLFADRMTKTRTVYGLASAEDFELRLPDVIAFLSGKVSL